MAASTTENSSLITGNLVKAILPSDNRKFKKIVLKINSKLTQIGDNNEIIGLEIPRSRTKAEGNSNMRCTSVDLNNESESGTSIIFIQANAVQLNVGGNELIEIEVNSDKVSLLQVGDRCKIHMKNDSKAEVNNEVVGSSTVYRRKLFVSRDDVMTGSEPVTRSKQRKRKPANKTSNTRQPIRKIRPAPLDSPECLELDQMFFEKVQKILQPLRDNGKWSLFDEKWNEFFVKYGNDPIWKALLNLEYGVRICYNSQYNSRYLEEAEKTLHEGKKIIETLQDIHPSITQFFLGRFYCYLASVHRRTKLWGRAHVLITEAEQTFQNTADSSFLYDKATVFYEKGSLYHEFDKRGIKEAKESFEKCYELCRQLKKKKGCDFIEKGQFAQFKKIMVLLGCSAQQGRKRRITDEDLEEAKKCIDEIDRENQERHAIPVSEQLQLLLAKSVYFRIADFSQAEELALQAVDLADQRGFDSWPAKKRLKDIQNNRHIVEEQMPTEQNHNEGNIETVDQRVSCDADGSGSQPSIGNSDN